MHILVHAINYSELTGPGKFTSQMCEWLASQGHQVVVVAPPPYYPLWRVKDPYQSWRYSTSIEANVRVRRTPIWLPRNPGGLARVLYGLSFALSSFPLVLWEAFRLPDVVFVVEPSFLNAPIAWIAARISGACAWLHVQDFEIDLAYDLGQVRRGRSIAAAIENWVTRRFDMVSSISTRMLARAARKGVRKERLFLLPNWFDAESLFPMIEPSEFRRRLNIPNDVPVALYSGTLGAKQGIEIVLEAAGALSSTPIQFVICGEGVLEGSLKSAAGSARNLRFLPLQPTGDLNSLLNLADIHLLPQRKGTAGSLFPSKLISMLATGRPVVAVSAAGSEIAEFVEGCGICVDHGDIEGFCAAIRRLAGDYGERSKMGRQARQRALDHFRQETALRKLEKSFEAQRHAGVQTQFFESTKDGVRK